MTKAKHEKLDNNKGHVYRGEIGAQLYDRAVENLLDNGWRKFAKSPDNMSSTLIYSFGDHEELQGMVAISFEENGDSYDYRLTDSLRKIDNPRPFGARELSEEKKAILEESIVGANWESPEKVVEKQHTLEKKNASDIDYWS